MNTGTPQNDALPVDQKAVLPPCNRPHAKLLRNLIVCKPDPAGIQDWLLRAPQFCLRKFYLKPSFFSGSRCQSLIIGKDFYG